MKEWINTTHPKTNKDADSFTQISVEIEREAQDTLEKDITQPLIEFFRKRVAIAPVPQTLAELIALRSRTALPQTHWPLTPRFATSEIKREQTIGQLRLITELALRIQGCHKRRQLAQQREGALTPLAYLAQISHAIIDTLSQPAYGSKNAIRGQLKQLLFGMQRKLQHRIVKLQKLSYLQQQALQTEGQPTVVNDASHEGRTFLSEREQLKQLEKTLLAQIKTVSERYRNTALKPVIHCIRRYVTPMRPPAYNPASGGMFSKKTHGATTLTSLLTDVNPTYERSRGTLCTDAHQRLVRTDLIPIERRLTQKDTGPDGALSVATVDDIARTLQTTLSSSQAIDRRYQPKRYQHPLDEALTPASPMTRALHKSLKRATAVRHQLKSLYDQLAATRQALGEKQPHTVTPSIRVALH